MRDFFKPWRRMMGCITLGLACVLTSGWIRSESRIDTLLFPEAWTMSKNEDTIVSFAIVSTKGTIGFVTTTYGLTKYDDSRSPPVKWSTQEMSVYDSSKTSCFNTPLRWHWRCVGFGYATDARTGVSGFAFIPYWSLAVSLTLLSAWLLLSKPRPAAPKQTTEPAPTTGADHA